MKNNTLMIAMKLPEDIEFVSNVMLLNGFEIKSAVDNSYDLLKNALIIVPDLIICDRSLEAPDSGIMALLEIEELQPAAFIITGNSEDITSNIPLPEHSPSVCLSTPLESEELILNASLLLKRNRNHTVNNRIQRLYGLVSEINDFVFSSDDTGIIIDADNELMVRLGFKHEEVVGKRFIDLVYTPDKKRIADAYLEGIKTGRKISKGLQFRLVLPDGSIRWFEISGIMVFDENGRMARGEGVLRDIDEFKTTELSLRDSEARYRALVNSQMESVCRWLPDMTLTFVNLGYCSFFGKSESELIGTRWIEMVPEKSRKEVEKFYMGMVFNPRIYRYEHEVVSANGSIRWQEWIDCPILDETGNLMEYQSVGRDITERKKLEETLRNLLKEKDEVINRISERKTNRGY